MGQKHSPFVQCFMLSVHRTSVHSISSDLTQPHGGRCYSLLMNEKRGGGT
jgi:hypothetical protein